MWITIGTCIDIPLLSAMHLNNDREDQTVFVLEFSDIFKLLETVIKPCNNKAFDFSSFSVLIPF